MAGLGTPVTGKMLIAPLARFLYVAIHEDCHEQFALPGGIEEALCNALAYAGMEQIARERFNDSPVEYRAISEFTSSGAARAEFMVGLYEELAAVYARHQSALISEETLLEQRAEIFSNAAQRLERSRAALNNIWLATAVTYGRHYRLMRRVIDAFDGDLAQAVAFFRRVDSAKLDRPSFAAKHGCGGEDNIAFVRAYEAAIVAVIERSLAAGNVLEDAGAVEWIHDAAPDSSACGRADLRQR
jgi:hypothetical protein